MVETREGGAPGTQVGAHDQAAGSGAGGRRRLVPPWGEAGGLSLGREGGAAHIGQATVPCVRSDEQTDPPGGESVPGRDRTGPRDPSGSWRDAASAARASRWRHRGRALMRPWPRAGVPAGGGGDPVAAVADAPRTSSGRKDIAKTVGAWPF